jgi:ethanolamine utilization protein EutP
MKRFMLIGKTSAGKTTLCQRIHDAEIMYRKTQSVEIYNYAIDTPGEYIENRSYYRALVVTSADADIIALVQDITQDINFFPPGFTSVFAKEVIGIITKCDLAKGQGELDRSEDLLKEAGVSKVFRISAYTGEGMEELVSYLNGE